MKRWWYVIVLVGCARSEPAPSTYGLGSPEHVQAVLQQYCGEPGPIDDRSEVDPGASPAQRSTWRKHCRLVGPERTVVGIASIEMRLNPGTGKPVCAIRIGPDRVIGPVDLSILPKLVEDPALSGAIEDLTRTVPPRGPYRVFTSVRGVLVRFELFQSRLDGPQMEMLLDGCDRYPAKASDWMPAEVPTEPLSFAE